MSSVPTGQVDPGVGAAYEVVPGALCEVAPGSEDDLVVGEEDWGDTPQAPRRGLRPLHPCYAFFLASSYQ
jgi:hypothetical protein